MQAAGRPAHIVVTCPEDACEGTLFFWPESRTPEGDAVADCCTCTRRYSMSDGQLVELATPEKPERVAVELA